MTAPRPKKRALSDRLKSMRFMKRQEETNLREKLLEEQKQREKEAHWTTETNGQHPQTTPVVLIEDGISGESVEGRVGRQSFGKFNRVFETCGMESNERKGGKGIPRNRAEDVKPSKEEPLSLADGITHKEHSDSETHPLAYRKVDLQGASRVIGKKRKKGTGDRRSRMNPRLLGNHRRNPF